MVVTGGDVVEMKRQSIYILCVLKLSTQYRRWFMLMNGICVAPKRGAMLEFNRMCSVDLLITPGGSKN